MTQCSAQGSRGGLAWSNCAYLSVGHLVFDRFADMVGGCVDIDGDWRLAH